MINWRDENEPIRQGLNLFRLDSPRSAGGYLQLGRLRLYARWAKDWKRLFTSVSWVRPDRIHLPRSAWWD